MATFDPKVLFQQNKNCTFNINRMERDLVVNNDIISDPMCISIANEIITQGQSAPGSIVKIPINIQDENSGWPLSLDPSLNFVLFFDNCCTDSKSSFYNSASITWDLEMNPAATLSDPNSLIDINYKINMPYVGHCLLCETIDRYEDSVFIYFSISFKGGLGVNPPIKSPQAIFYEFEMNKDCCTSDIIDTIDQLTANGGKNLTFVKTASNSNVKRVRAIQYYSRVPVGSPPFSNGYGGYHNPLHKTYFNVAKFAFQYENETTGQSMIDFWPESGSPGFAGWYWARDSWLQRISFTKCFCEEDQSAAPCPDVSCIGLVNEINNEDGDLEPGSWLMLPADIQDPTLPVAAFGPPAFYITLNFENCCTTTTNSFDNSAWAGSWTLDFNKQVNPSNLESLLSIKYEISLPTSHCFKIVQNPKRKGLFTYFSLSTQGGCVISPNKSNPQAIYYEINFSSCDNLINIISKITAQPNSADMIFISEPGIISVRALQFFTTEQKQNQIVTDPLGGYYQQSTYTWNLRAIDAFNNPASVLFWNDNAEPDRWYWAKESWLKQISLGQCLCKE